MYTHMSSYTYAHIRASVQMGTQHSSKEKQENDANKIALQENYYVFGDS